MQQRNDDAARARTDVANQGRQFYCDHSKRGFHEQFRLGPRYQDIVIDFKVETKKFLMR